MIDASCWCWRSERWPRRSAQKIHWGRSILVPTSPQRSELVNCLHSTPCLLASHNSFSMGWFWGDNKNDPVKKLDPGLREFLEQETPDKYEPAPDVKQPAPTPSPSQSPSSQEPSDSSEPKVPAASLYQDGRYADLWKTYKPPSSVDSTPVGGAERVVEKYKEHGDTVQRAAMENCALEHEALTFCFQRGGWLKQIESRLTMCSAENATFSRCFQTQSVSPRPLDAHSPYTHFQSC